MDRREFLRSAGAVAGAAAVPRLLSAGWHREAFEWVGLFIDVQRDTSATFSVFSINPMEHHMYPLLWTGVTLDEVFPVRRHIAQWQSGPENLLGDKRTDHRWIRDQVSKVLSAASGDVRFGCIHGFLTKRQQLVMESTVAADWRCSKDVIKKDGVADVLVSKFPMAWCQNPDGTEDVTGCLGYRKPTLTLDYEWTPSDSRITIDCAEACTRFDGVRECLILPKYRYKETCVVHGDVAKFESVLCS